MDTQGFIGAAENVPFAVALAMMGMIAVLEGLALVIGGGLSKVLDPLLPDLDGLDGSHSSLSTILSWLRVGQVPVLVLIVAFLTGFGALGYAVQGSVLNLTGHMLSPALASGAALLGAIPATHLMGGALAAVLPRDETSAVSSSEFRGPRGRHHARHGVTRARGGGAAQR